MEHSIKNRNILVLVFELIVIAVAVAGFTFATQKIINDRTSTLITTDEYGLDYVGDKNISIGELEPISDSLVDYNTRDKVIRVEFSVRGVNTNKRDDLIYDVMLDKMNIDCSLLNKYTKWNLYKNGRLLANGSFDPAFDGNVLSDSLRLTEIQEDLPKYNEEYDNYVFIVWISEACEDLEKCDLIDQSAIVNSKFSMNIFIALYSGEKKKYVRISNYDGTCANKPILTDKMVPVTYKDGVWVVADSTNSDMNNLWYSYGNQKWANSVIVNNANKYKKVGETVNEKDVLGYFVWIPRFRYKLWNVSFEKKESYYAYDDGIQIMFENGLNSSDSNRENNNYITHPVFGSDLRGFWISKYEMSKEDNIYKFISSIDSYRSDTLDNYQLIGNGIANDYKLGNDATSHMVTNLEWGSVLYLSHSDYGVCSGDGCAKIDSNATYIAGNNKQDTTTRNVYGVYDMAGGSGEYVIGKSELGTATGEVYSTEGDTWYNGHSMVSSSDYIIRGGLSRGLFYFGDYNMDPVEIGTRVSLYNNVR